VAAISTDPVVAGLSYEEFVELHAKRFVDYLRGVLGAQAEGRGGRVAVDDTLQEALLAIYAEWPELARAGVQERDRRVYRCLRDAAGEALRSEYGRRSRRSEQPRVLAFDFGKLHRFSSEQESPQERELTVTVLGAMVRDLALSERQPEARATLDRAILVAGLRALSEREVVVLIAVEHLGWDQHQLADQLEIGFGALRQTLFSARKVFYALVRHAVGVELDEQERARLAAYLAGELTGTEKRETKRHVQHCQACQDLQREQRVFGRDALGVLAPLPFVFGADVLAKRSSTKGAATGSGVGSGLFAQPGAAKAAIVVVGLLGVGVGTSAVLAELAEHQHHGPHVSAPASSTYLAPPRGGMTRIAVPTSTSGAHKRSTVHRAGSSRPSSSSSSAATSSPPATQQTTTNQSTTPPSTGSQAPSGSSSTPSKKSGGGGGEFFSG
jgi:DNA-directed RNA polymerase specialized sigma24 family protein